MHTSDIPTNLWEPLSSSFNQCCAPGTAGAQGPFAQCDSFQRSHTLSVCFLLKNCMIMSRTLSPCPHFTAEVRLWARGGDNANISSANQGEVPRLEAVRADTHHASSSPPCCTVKAPGAVSKNAELSPHLHPDESESPGWGQGD